ncbi:MAG: NifU family protein [Anaerolineae bacterium]|nr:NifU family protein [Anaerolineae bacterium]
MTEDKAFQERLQRVETLINQIQTSANPMVQTSVEELIQTLLELHGVGLEAMLDVIWESGEAGQSIIHDHLASDKLVSSLLLLHGLHPLPLENRVQQALEKVRPYLESHGGNVELLDITGGVVQLRLRGSCEGCAASSMTLKYAIEEAIYEVAPDVVSIEALGITPQPAQQANFIPVEQLTGSKENGHGWQTVTNLPSLDQGQVHIQQVSAESVVFCQVGDNFYAYRNRCPHCQQSLDQAQLKKTTLICPSCRQSFDVIRAGRGLDKPDIQLAPFP